jgi:signal transduction histidine kinase
VPHSDSGSIAQPQSALLRFRHSLLLKLAGFYLLISLPTLLLVEAAVLSYEFHEFAEAVDDGAMLRAVQSESEQLGTLLSGGAALSQAQIARELDSWILEMERPSPSGELQSYILLELSDQPFAAMLKPLGAERGIHNAATAHWRIDAAELPTWTAAEGSAAELARHDAPEWMRRYVVPVRSGNGPVVGHLVLEIQLPLPWRKLLFKVSYEWPLLIAYLLVFSLGTVLFFRRWVTRRLHRIADAADSWRQGEFAALIDDADNDELGELSRRLDRMAADLRDLVHARAEVAMLNERARLARDLHDTVKQKAFALTLQIAALRAELRRIGCEPGPALDESRKLAEEIQRELALILNEMRHDDSAETFHDEMHARIQAWARRSGLQVQQNLAATDRVAHEHRDTLARLVDEALANVQRHSGASRVDIELVDLGTKLRLQIADDGRGMPTQRSAGMGLRNMHRRAADLPGGLLEVVTGPGVRIMVTWNHQESAS